MSKIVRSAHQNILGPQLTYSKCLFYLTVQTPKIFSLVSQKIKKMGKYIPLRALNQNILGIFFFCLKNNLKRLIDYQYCCRIIFCPLINRLIISFQQMNTAGYVQCIPEPLLFFISALFFFFFIPEYNCPVWHHVEIFLALHPSYINAKHLGFWCVRKGLLSHCYTLLTFNYQTDVLQQQWAQ